MKRVRHSVQEVLRAAKTLDTQEAMQFIQNAAQLISDCFRKGGKVLLAGNGGSLCDAMHFAEELTGYFRDKRKALPAITLSDPGHMTCVANDTSFDEIFSRGVEAYGKKGDILIVLTTSGNSSNLLRAVEEAAHQKVQTIAFLGQTGGKLKGVCDLQWIVEGFDYSDRIQEAHMAAIHIIIELIEINLFSNKENKLKDKTLDLFSDLKSVK